MPNTTQQSWKSRFRKTSLNISLALCGWMVNSTIAEEKRITVAIPLPFQQSTSAAASAAALPKETDRAYAVRATTFTQSTQRTVPGTSAQLSSVIGDGNQKSLQPGLLPAALAVPESISEAAYTSSVFGLGVSSSAASATSVIQSKPERKIVATKHVQTEPIKAVRHPAGHPEAFVAEFENYVATKIAPFVPGAAVAIVSGGQIKSLQAFGVKTAGTREKLTPDTVFRLASVSKTIASTSAAMMVNNGHLTWDTTVVSQLHQVKFKNSKYGDQLTLKHLLSQSSGFPTHTYSHYIDSNMSYAETVERLRYVNFVCPPGKCYAYQNVVYSLAGEMMEKKAGIDYEDYVEQNLFQPLGMRSSSFGLEDFTAAPNRAVPHIASGKRWIPTAVTGNWYHVPPAAGANASIADMSRFLLAQLGKRQDVLSKATLDDIQSRVTKNTPAQNHYGTRKGVTNTAYGLGWRVFDYGRHKNFNHHGGWVKGFRSEVVFNRDLQIGMVFLTNSESRLAREVIFKFMDMYASSQQAAKQAAKKK